jgi:hypothetical protein
MGAKKLGGSSDNSAAAKAAEKAAGKAAETSLFEFNYREAAQDLYPRHMEETVWPPLIGNEHNERFGWIRPRNVKQQDALPAHLNVSRVGYYKYRRATYNQFERASTFNLYEWIVGIVDSISGWGILPWLQQGFINAQQFVLNPNYKCEDYPNVGLKYYAVFELQCSFPCNVDCRNGIGLEQALGQILIYYGLAFLICLFIFQSGLSLLISTLVLFIVFVMVLMGLAWGYSVRCLFLTPVIIPVLGFRVAWIPLFPVVSIYPFCAVDDTIALIDKWINDCYDFLWPSYFLYSQVCPACPGRISVPNCLKDIGIGDGLSNYLYLGYWLWGPNFCSVVQSVGQIFAFIIPGIPAYLSGQCSNYISTDPEVFQFCFWATLPSMVLPLALGALGATFLGFVIPAIFNVIIALWVVIITSPLGILWGAAQNFFQPGLDEDENKRSSSSSDDDDDSQRYYRRRRQMRDFDDDDFDQRYGGDVYEKRGRRRKRRNNGAFFMGVKFLSQTIQSAVRDYRVIPVIQQKQKMD